MGTIILFMAVGIEIALATLCIFTRSNQPKVRSLIRIGTFAGFVAGSIASVIDWSLRYYTLGGFLFLLAVIGAVTLVRKEEDKLAYRPGHVIRKATGMIILISILSLPALVFPQYEMIKRTGRYQVAYVTHTYTDPDRVETYSNTGDTRKLNIAFWYPKDAAGIHPLVVFSHGSFGTKSSNESLYNELASHGYVVCSIDHTYQAFSTVDEDGKVTLLDRGFMREVSTENARVDRQQSFNYYQKWMAIRTGDIDSVIDHILAEAASAGVDEVYKLVDRSRIGVMGHSLGGSAALGIGRMRDDVSAVIALESPFMCDIEGVEDGEFAFTDEKYPVPVLNVYSDGIWSLLPDRPQYAANYALLSGANETAFNVHIKGVGHLTLTDLALASPFLTRVLNGHSSTTDTRYCLETINKISLEFFNAYLKGDGKFSAYGTY